MAFFWVQQWVALPVVLEHQMGDLPPGSRPQALDNATTGFVRDGNPSNSTAYKSPDNNTPFYSQLSTLPQPQLRSDFRSSAHPSTQYQYQDHGSSLMNMALMAGALPEYAPYDDSSVNPQPVPRSLSGASTSAVAYQLGQNLQMAAHSAGNLPNSPPYGPGFAANPYQNFMPLQGSQPGGYPPFGANQQRQVGAGTTQAPFQNYPQSSQFMYFPPPYESHGQFAPAYTAQASQGQAVYGRRTSLTHTAQGTDFTHMDSNFSSARMAPGSLPGDQGSFGPTYGVPFMAGPGKRTPRLIQLHRKHNYLAHDC